MKKQISKVFSLLGAGVVGAVAGVIASGHKAAKKTKKAWGYADKHLALMQLLNQWLITKQEGKSILTYFHENGYKRIAIYGMSYVGERLYDELKNTDVEIAYAIDRNADRIYADIDILTMDDDLNEVDAVIVTPITFFDELEEQLIEKLSCPIISIEDILYEI